jgi:hypothetical protein
MGWQEWFSQRALLPPTLPSITRPSASPKMNVWPRMPARRNRAEARRHDVTSPRYSRIRWPAGIACSAKTPRP